jgi:outer membrane receptor for ferrienterochelin and colicins
VIGDISGNVDLSRIDMSRVKRIEVLDGAASALYGSDAIGGVINIITDQPKDEIISVTSQTQVGGNGKFSEKVNLNISTGILGSYTSYDHDESDYYQNNDLTYVDKEAGTTKKTVDGIGIGYTSHVADQRFTLDPLRHLSLYAQGTYSWKQTRRPRVVEGLAGGSAYEIRSEGMRWGAGGTYKLSTDNQLQFDFVADKYQYGNHYEQESGNYAVGDYTMSKRQRYYDAELKGLFKFTENSTSIFGLDWRNDFLCATSGDVDNHVYTMAAYAQHDLTLLTNLSATVGLRYTRHEAFGNDFTPKVSLMYNLGDFRFRAAYSRGFRAPGLDELYYHYFKLMKGRPVITFGNEDLKAEKSNYASLSAEYTNDRFSLSVMGYINRVDNMIVKETIKIDDATRRELAESFPEATAEQLAGMTTYGHYVNSNKGDVKGLQVNATYNITRDLVFIANYSYTYARTQSGEEWQNLERSIRNTCTLTANYGHTWGKYRLGVNINGRLQSRTYYPSYEDAPGYGVWNLHTTHTITPNQRLIIEPGLGIDNIWNKTDHRIDGTKTRYALYSPGRTIMGSLKLKF